MIVFFPKYYKSIYDCPAKIFHEVMAGELPKTALCYKGRPSQKKANRIWDEISNEYIKEFDIDQNYKTYLKKMLTACEYWKLAYVDGIKPYKIWAKKEAAEALVLLGGIRAGGKRSYAKAAASVSRAMGFYIKANEVTVAEFYGYVKTMESNG